MNHATKRSLAIGILGVALLLALAAGAAVGRGHGASAVGETATGGQYQLIPPNELEPAGGFSGVPAAPGPWAYRADDARLDAWGAFADAPPDEAPIPASGSGGVYRTRPPSETDAGGSGHASPAPARSVPSRVSPPNEQDPAGP